MGFVCHFALLAIPFAIWGTRGLATRTAARRALVWSFVGVIPFVLFSYPHIRYFARYYPIAGVLVLSAVERIASLPDGPRRNIAFSGAVVCLALALAENVRRISTNWALLPDLDRYWFPD